MDWSQDFESGLADIDVQHRYIFALIQRVNQLDDRIERSELREVAVELGRLALCHFGCEERLMVAYEYPEGLRHIAEHRKLETVVQTFRRDDNYHAHNLALFLCNWLVSHTMLEDRQLAAHILKLRARAMGMSVSDLVEGVKLHRTSATYLAAGVVDHGAIRNSG
jgi:hemerythrin-like metal-binding protein